jgi:4'-phosphopantetheinyl transferase
MSSTTSWASPYGPMCTATEGRAGSAPQPAPAGVCRCHFSDRRPCSTCTWQVPHDLLELQSGEVHLWRVDLDRNMDGLPALEQTLAREERAKAGQFRFELHRNRYVVAHGALRTILARYLKTTPCKPVFRCGSHGRPELASGAVYFSMSHSHDLALCAISRARHLGVDVEHVRPGVETDLAGCFSPRALRFLEPLPQPARRHAFFQGWTRMEAYSKASGEGLDSGLETFEIFLDLRTPVLHRPLGDAEQRWWLHDFSPRRGYVGALAAPPGNCSLRYCKWQADELGNTTQIDAT